MSFKPGDRIRVRTIEQMLADGYELDEDGNVDVPLDFATEMQQYIGHTGTVEECDCYDVQVYIKWDIPHTGRDWHWSKPMLEIIPISNAKWRRRLKGN